MALSLVHKTEQTTVSCVLDKSYERRSKPWQLQRKLLRRKHQPRRPLQKHRRRKLLQKHQRRRAALRSANLAATQNGGSLCENVGMGNHPLFVWPEIGRAHV